MRNMLRVECFVITKKSQASTLQSVGRFYIGFITSKGDDFQVDFNFQNTASHGTLVGTQVFDWCFALINAIKMLTADSITARCRQ